MSNCSICPGNSPLGQKSYFAIVSLPQGKVTEMRETPATEAQVTNVVNSEGASASGAGKAIGPPFAPEAAGRLE